MGFKNDGVQVSEYVYDFAEDGGATGEIVLSTKPGRAAIPVGALIKRVTALVKTAVTSAGAPTLAWGNGDDPDGYSGAGHLKGALLINTSFNGYDNAAALLWDDTNDHMIDVPVVDADDGKFSVTIATAALTAGKVVFMVEHYMPLA